MCQLQTTFRVVKSHLLLRVKSLVKVFRYCRSFRLFPVMFTENVNFEFSYVVVLGSVPLNIR